MRLESLAGDTRAGFDQVVPLLDFFGNCWNERLMCDIIGIAKALCFFEKCKSFVTAALLLF